MPEEETKIEEDSYLSSVHAFHLQMPLYRIYDLAIGSIKERIIDLMQFNRTIDAYCLWCKKQSVFHASPASSWVNSQWQKQIAGDLQEFELYCVHDSKHRYKSYFFVKEGENEFQKIGQLPSAADFQIPQAEKYRSILGNELFKEMVRGIGLAAHGVGIGSFVYIRRVFERLIDGAHDEAVAAGNLDEDQYAKSRMDERIQIVKDYLPPFLVENRRLYSVLSKGIHELTEKECLAYFEAVRIGIEQILDEKIEVEEKTVKAARAKAAVRDLLQKTPN